MKTHPMKSHTLWIVMLVIVLMTSFVAALPTNNGSNGHNPFVQLQNAVTVLEQTVADLSSQLSQVVNLINHQEAAIEDLSYQVQLQQSQITELKTFLAQQQALTLDLLAQIQELQGSEGSDGSSTPPAQEPDVIFMKMGTLHGPLNEAGYEGWFEVVSYTEDFDESDLPTGQPASPFFIKKQVDSISPLLLDAMNTNTLQELNEIHFFRQENGVRSSLPYLIIRLNDIIIISHEVTSDAVTEKYSFTTMEYWIVEPTYASDGSITETVLFHWENYWHV